MTLTNESIDILLNAKQINGQQKILCLETSVKPMHVYQLVIACNEKLHEFAINEGIRPSFLVVSKPMKYIPEDVHIAANLLLTDVRRLAAKLAIPNMPTELRAFNTDFHSENRGSYICSTSLLLLKSNISYQYLNLFIKYCELACYK